MDSTWLGMMVCVCNPSTLEVEAGGSQVRGQFGLHSENLSKKKKKDTGKLEWIILETPPLRLWGRE
jgi:hypothetical protein